MSAITVGQDPRPGRLPLLSRLCLSWLALSLGLRAATTFYVDSDWTGMPNGTASQPWKSLSSDAWSGINSALATGDVTVYFSAREASSDTDDLYDIDGDRVQDIIDLNFRTDAGSGVLTLDGSSMYNTSDTTPAWRAYSGPSRSKVLYVTAQNSTHRKISNITLHGLHVATTDGNKEMAICGDNWIVENCECNHTSSASDGPGILLVPTADGAHEGSWDYTPPCTNIVIRNNIVHDTFGEAIYLGGAGPNDGTPGAGYPSHSHITIESNLVYHAGEWGGQGDGIDVKAGICFLTIRANEIYGITNSPITARAIVIQGQVPGASQTTLIEGNRIHDCTRIEDAAVVVVDTWGTPQGVTIRNNVIYNMNEAGIRIYNSQDPVRIYNNTISGCGSVAILAFSQVSVINNLAFNNNRDDAQVAFVGGTAQCDYNAYSGQWGYSPVGSSSVNLSGTDLTNTVTSAATGDFTLKAGSPAIGKAKVLSGFRTDIVGRARGVFWDIGAYQHTSSNSRPPQPPTGLRIAAP